MENDQLIEHKPARQQTLQMNEKTHFVLIYINKLNKYYRQIK